MQEVAKRFIPVADEVGYLQRSKGPEGAFFRSFCEKGHYGGRTRPTETRQGIYCVAPSGAFLASVNHNDPRRVEAMLREALAAWEKLPAAERRSEEAPRPQRRERIEERFPEGGVALAVTTRDLPRPGDGRHGREARDWRRDAWNRDHAWLTAEEAAALVPPDAKPGARVAWPAATARRLARCHLVDFVRGQTPAMPDGAVVVAEARSVVVRVEGDRVTLRLEGEFDLLHRGRWSIEGLRADGGAAERERAFTGSLHGTAVFDRAAKRFVALEAVVAGVRRGATQYNGRADDPGPAPQGFVIALEPPGAPLVAPAAYWAYGW